MCVCVCNLCVYMDKIVYSTILVENWRISSSSIVALHHFEMSEHDTDQPLIYGTPYISEVLRGVNVAPFLQASTSLQSTYIL